MKYVWHGEREPAEKSLQNLTTICWTLTKTCNGKTVTREKKGPVGRENNRNWKIQCISCSDASYTTTK